MDSLKTILHNLPDKEQRALLYALEQGVSYTHVTSEGTFVSVNSNPPQTYKVVLQNGPWKAGTTS